jgi:hypothetical protein
MTLLAEAIAKEEGYGIPGALPTRNNNPGDLRHSPHSFHLGGDPNGIGIIDNPADGWADLERQLELFARRGYTLRQTIYEWAPPTENNTPQYLGFVARYLSDASGQPVTEDMSLIDALALQRRIV